MAIYVHIRIHAMRSKMFVNEKCSPKNERKMKWANVHAM